MKKILIMLSVTLIGCSSTVNQSYPHYHVTPAITQEADDTSYWESVSKVPPTYPSNALMSGIEGCAKIGFTITPDGTIADPFVIKSFPVQVFDRVSIEAALKFKFKPSSSNASLEPVISSNTFTFGQSDGGGFSYEKLSRNCE